MSETEEHLIYFVTLNLRFIEVHIMVINNDSAHSLDDLYDCKVYVLHFSLVLLHFPPLKNSTCSF